MSTFRKLSLLCATMAGIWPAAEIVAFDCVATMTWAASFLSLALAVEFWIMSDDDEI